MAGREGGDEWTTLHYDLCLHDRFADLPKTDNTFSVAPQALLLVRNAVVGNSTSNRSKGGEWPAEVNADEIFNGIIANNGDGIHSKSMMMALAAMCQRDGAFETANANTMEVLERLRLILMNLKELREQTSRRSAKKHRGKSG